MNENMEFKHALLVKWFRILFYIHVASIVNSLISFLPIPGTLTTLVSRLIMVGAILCMFQLAGVNERYKKAAIFRTVMLGGALINAYLFSSTLILLASSIFSIIAVYQEYSGHSDLVADKNPKLSRSWHSLFNWGILAAVLTSFGSVITVLLVTMVGMDLVKTQSIIIGILNIPQLAIDAVYLLYLRKMIRIFQVEGEVYRNDV